ncbi:Putative uncharacterized protein [Taphrina deformans PYCC 5710]|uniref:Acyltransferase 3 domain-containing protein n=1 Tax=Taphrina deformans (strain PYCC 5710 / ATCC 11124 / CBS 356.35 / IMI 108563 / JCM 9778 / NBRC 8474) TaxID=1097556 RepID=R4XBD3_TAPDE|nr:Putative uncharacterized protein [Taphrina deformans PYCC 5710]|eukprot:CCG80643.1 Putative uncharacterized protein [Taphrina deformans PYCC 5710]
MPAKHDSILDNGHWEKNRSNINLTATNEHNEPPLQAPSTAGRPFNHKDWIPESPGSAVRALLRVLTPSILEPSRAPPKSLRSTAYLDGLRGFAALMVYLGHHQAWAHELSSSGVVAEHAYGYSKRFFFICLPGIRIFFSGGHVSVCIFFVISGYVLAAKPLALIQAGDRLKLADNLGSALFRRWLRLYIPVLGTTFLFMTSWHAFGIWTAWPKHQADYRHECWEWYAAVKNYSFVFKGTGEPWLSYNFHAWSIPTEFRGSLVIYTSLLAFSRATRNARLWCQLGLIFYFLYIVDGWFCALFSAGMLLCDLDLLAKADNLPDLFGRLKKFREVIFINLFIVGMYLGGVPHANTDIDLLKVQPGWYYLALLKPQAVWDYKWFYLFFASVLIVGSIRHLKWLRRFFELRFNLYLGRISFALYLVHGPVLWTLGDRLYAAVGWARESHREGIPAWVDYYPMSKAGPFGMELSFVAVHLVLFPVTLWLAEIATKVFDEPSIQFSQWAYRRTLG